MIGFYCVESLKKELIGALIGLGRAAEGNKNRPSSQTHRALLSGFKMLSSYSEVSFQCVEKHISVLHEEKYKLVSRCMTCTKQCGRNNDYDINDIELLPAEMCALKYELIAMIITCASYVDRPFIEEKLNTEAMAFFYDALFIVGSTYSGEKHQACLEYGVVLLRRLVKDYFES